MGCCYKSLGNMKEALKYLKKAIKISTKTRDLSLLNLSVVYS